MGILHLDQVRSSPIWMLAAESCGGTGSDIRRFIGPLSIYLTIYVNKCDKYLIL